MIFNFSKLKDRTQDFVFVKQSCLLSDSEWFQNAISRKEQIKNSNHLEQSAIKFRISKLAKMRSNG